MVTPPVPPSASFAMSAVAALATRTRAVIAKSCHGNARHFPLPLPLPLLLPPPRLSLVRRWLSRRCLHLSSSRLCLSTRNLGLSRPRCLMSAGASPTVCLLFAGWLLRCMLLRASALHHLLSRMMATARRAVAIIVDFVLRCAVTIVVDVVVRRAVAIIVDVVVCCAVAIVVAGVVVHCTVAIIINVVVRCIVVVVVVVRCRPSCGHHRHRRCHRQCCHPSHRHHHSCQLRPPLPHLDHRCCQRPLRHHC